MGKRDSLRLCGRKAAESLLSNVYKAPQNYTDNIKYVGALKDNLIEGIL